ncbi:polynucleotide kinase-phosphatase [Deinococcus psychrotolerans]|uniref:polynucleotide kinase-phosphatase n=1 Tax=Deinococcus psychrotolerans TaxID=2489213 RepID=UPI0019D179E9|nr:polynucleotide kinase-phosphatase [Deinococcus psychrotolerans]
MSDVSPLEIPIDLPELCLVALVGASSAGKTHFAAQHFLPSETLSSDFFRRLVSDDEAALDANADAFDSLFFVAGKRLTRGRLTVVDATSVRPDDRQRLIKLARQYDVPAVAIVLDLPLKVLQARHAERSDRALSPDVIKRQHLELRRTLNGLSKEGFRQVWALRSEEEISAAQIRRVPLNANKKDLLGPFDFIGDVHGCLSELRALLTQLGYVNGQHPQGRTAVFVGDLIDRGPDSAGVLDLVMKMVHSGQALCVIGNHDDKLMRVLDGQKATLKHGLADTVRQLEERGEAFKTQVRTFLRGLTGHLQLDGGAVVVAHAGLPEAYQGRSSGRVRSFALYGDVDGSTDEWGMPVRRDWAKGYSGGGRVIYGHTPVARPVWVNRTLNLDTGCVFGGALTALRYPELELVSVPALAQYAAPSRPFLPLAGGADAPLEWADFSGDQRLETRTFGSVNLKAAEMRGALEVFGRFGIDPADALYLPPTMSPVETSSRPDYLEHPDEAFAYYRAEGQAEVICQEKHMGSRTLLLLRQDASGAIYTRTGRPFFKDAAWERDLLERATQAATRAGLWEALKTDWLLLDAEILPWNFKAGELLRGQYAPVAAAGETALGAAVQLLEQAQRRGLPLAEVLSHTQTRAEDLHAYRQAYRAYVRQVDTPADLKVAPFHLLASKGAVHDDQTHLWHLEMLGQLVDAAPDLFISTAAQIFNLNDPASQQAATDWWLSLTAQGGEGMVVKPLHFRQDDKRLLQPALKVRGREYLRIIYGPEYTQPQHLVRLKARAVKAKRGRAVREFHLGLEGLRRFSEGAGISAVHPYVLGVLALEQGELDARL